MSDMFFIPTLKAFLKEKGEIYTVRRFKYVTHECDVEGVGRCDRHFIKRVNIQDDLACYIDASGFALQSQWWKTVRHFIKPGEDMFLFRVVVKR